MSEKTIQVDLPILLPDIQDARDNCLAMLTHMLENQRGIKQVHITHEKTPTQLCLHYDPNLISLSAVERMVWDAGGQFKDRYRHEAIDVIGMHTADAATGLAEILSNLPGMLHVTVSYTARTAFVAYESDILQPNTIYQAIGQVGYKASMPQGADKKRKGRETNKEHEEHDHGSAPSFLPHWLQERWELFLVALAGVFILVGWVGETLFDLPEAIVLFLFIGAYIAGGYDIATHAIPSLFKGKFDTDVLMLAAATGAALLGEWAEGAFLLFLFGLGHAGEHYALDRARNAIDSLGELMPKTARVKQNGEIQERPVEEVKVGDVVVVRPGDRIPVDGEIVSGQSAIDQSAITGESVPVSKLEGDEVFAGTVNQENALDIRVTKLAKDNTLNRVMQMVAEAQGQQSPTQQFTQRFTAKFVPAVLIFVALVIVVPPIIGWMPWQDSFYRAMLLLIAASPCALAVGTPASVLAGIAQAARNGVLIKGGVHLENLGRLNVMAFDKTGTLTEGKFKVTDIVPIGNTSEETLLSIAAAVEQQSNHPLAIAVVQAAKEKELTLLEANSLENITGRGVKSEIKGQVVLIGSHKLFQEADAPSLAGEEKLVERVNQLEEEGKTTMIVSQGSSFLGVLALADTARPQVKETLQALLDLGVKKLVMLTGDNEDVAQKIGKEIGVTDIRASLLPEQKLEAIKALQQEHGDIAMTGDGVNDAPALATATVGIAMGGAGTAVALDTADVALMADDLGKLPFTVGLSRASQAIIRQNLYISLGVIGLLILSSVLGIVALSGAVVLHEGSTILVVLNALRLLRYKDEH